MTRGNALEGPAKEPAGSSTGFRRLRRDSLSADRIAENFAGLPDGVTRPGQLLAAFKGAAPRLGISPKLVHAVDWLFGFSREQDWAKGGGHPIVWPAARLQQEALGRSATQVKVINRALIEAGLVTMKDSPNGKRHGKRDSKGNIVEAYGFDLSPIAMRYAEFVQLGKEAREEREEMGRLRRRATIAGNCITQILESVAAYDFVGEEWATLGRQARDLRRALRKVERPEEMAIGVESLERRQVSARERLESLLAAAAVPDASEAVDSDPKGPENRPHYYSYNLTPNPEQDTVVAAEESSEAGGQAAEPLPPAVQREASEHGGQLRVSPDALVQLAPRLNPWMPRPAPPGNPVSFTWPQVVEAADCLAGELDIAKPLLAEAYRVMGRNRTAIAIAIVSAKDPTHIRKTAAGYFHGMVNKDKIGQLYLDRTLWRMLRANQRPPTGLGSSAEKDARPNQDSQKEREASKEDALGRRPDRGSRDDLNLLADRKAAMEARLAAQYNARRQL